MSKKVSKSQRKLMRLRKAQYIESKARELINNIYRSAEEADKEETPTISQTEELSAKKSD